MVKIQAYVILGCNGFKNKTFKYCNGIINPIIDLDKIPDDIYEDFVNFLERSCELFDGPVLDHNKCSNILNMIHKKYSLYSNEKLIDIQKFLKMHKDCGIFINLVLKENYYG